MKSHLTHQFITNFNALPDRIKKLARKNYKIWSENHYHPSLNFKEIRNDTNIYSVRIGIGWRALGIIAEDNIIWFWIGSHSDYIKMIEK